MAPVQRLDARVRGHDHKGVIPAKAGIQQVVLERYMGSQNPLTWRLCGSDLPWYQTYCCRRSLDKQGEQGRQLPNVERGRGDFVIRHGVKNP